MTSAPILGTDTLGICEDTISLSTGLSSIVAYEALDMLKKIKISARMVHLPSIKPTDTDLIVKCAKETKAIITVEDHSIYGGLGGLVSEIVSSKHPTRVIRIGMKDKFGINADLDFLMNYYGINIENIVSSAKSILKPKN